MSGPALLWTDIESSGLEEDQHYILEVGFRVTDADLETLAEESWVIWWSNIGSIKRRASEQVQAMHAASGLWDECTRSREDGGAGGTEWPLRDGLAGVMTRWLGDHGAKGLPLAGSTVGFDRRWLNHWLPGFSDIPHYRSVDVSSLKVLFDLWATDGQKAARAELKPMKRHRVMPDLDDSIAELRFYRSVLGFGDLAEELRQERLRHHRRDGGREPADRGGAAHGPRRDADRGHRHREPGRGACV